MSLVVPLEEIFANKTGLLANHQSWQRVELGAVCRILNGFAFKSSRFNNDKGFPIIRIRDLSKGTAETLYDGDFPPDYIVDSGDLLIGMDGNFACWEWSGGKAGLNQRVCKIIPSEESICRKFVFYGLNGYLMAIQDATSSVTVGHLSSLDILKIPFPLPPLNEQRRIVAKLEDVLTRVDASQQRLAKIPVILKRFRQAVLAAACSGRLTSDWREENPSAFVEKQAVDESLPDIPESWKWVKFGQLTTMFRSGSTEVPVNETTSFPILRSSSVRIGSVDFSDVRYLSDQQSTNPANFIQDFDLLFTRLSGSLEYVANCGLVRGLSGKKLQYPDRLFCARLKDQSTAPYLEICFGSPVLREFITISSKSSAGHQRISMGAITEQPIPYPPLPEQQEIVRRVESFFTLADQLEARYRKAKTHVDKLTQSILAKAFRGELVPQDPNDEPAAVLLERIRKQKQSVPQVSKKIDAQKKSIAKEH